MCLNVSKTVISVYLCFHSNTVTVETVEAVDKEEAVTAIYWSLRCMTAPSQ